MLGLSGFGWDDVTKTLQCEKSVYDDWVKVIFFALFFEFKRVIYRKTFIILIFLLQNHKKATGLYGVPFPYFDVLSEIFGKDRATRDNVEMFDEAINNIDVDIETQTINLDSGDEDTDDESVTRSVTRSIKKEFVLEPPLKKMKRANK